jgi:hypothetical protein
MNAVDLSQRSRLSGIQISGFLGLDLLDGEVVVLDTVHRTIHLERVDPGSVRNRNRRTGP